MPVDKFGRMSDTKTTDSGVSLTYINNNYVRSDGGTPLTGSLDMKGNIIYNVAEPVNPQDVATKVYVDNTKGSGVIGRKIGDSVSIKENMDFMGKQKIKNLPDPVNDHGHYRATAPLDIDNHKIENLPEPLEDGDAVNKKYVDGVVEDLTLKQGLIRENGGFNLVDSYINMNFNNIRNVGLPNHEADAVPRSFVDEEIQTVMKQVFNQFKQLNQLVSVCGSFYGRLKKDDYQFTFGGAILQEELNDLKRLNGFLVPANGVLKNFFTFSTGLILTIPGKSFKEVLDENLKPIVDLYGNSDSLVKIFSLVKIEEKGKEEEELGGIYFRLINISLYGEDYKATSDFKFIIAEKFRNKEENFICSVNRGDIINIRSEYEEGDIDVFSGAYASFPFGNYSKPGEEKKKTR